jgi:hypothetical protein
VLGVADEAVQPVRSNTTAATFQNRSRNIEDSHPARSSSTVGCTATLANVDTPGRVLALWPMRPG